MCPRYKWNSIYIVKGGEDMLKELVVQLTYVSEIKDGKEVMKSRRFNQVRLDITDVEINVFKDLIARLTNDSYIAVDKIETKMI